MITNLEDAPVNRWIYVRSSNIHQVWYDPESEVLKIAFMPVGSGVTYYGYYRVPGFIYLGLLNAESKGKYHRQNIRNRFDYKQLGYGGS